MKPCFSRNQALFCTICLLGCIFFREKFMRKNIYMKKVSLVSIILSILLMIVCIFLLVFGKQTFTEVKVSAEKYQVCEEAAKKLQSASDYLTEQVRAYVITGDSKYMDLYFEEVNETKTRQKAIQQLNKQNIDTTEIKSALSASNDLLKTEEYAMKLVLEANNQVQYPQELENIHIRSVDEALSSAQKLERAKDLVFNTQYQSMRSKISKDVDEYMDSLIESTKNQQNHAETAFTDVYTKIIGSLMMYFVLVLFIGFVVIKYILKPLLVYNEKIKENALFPEEGVMELKNLAKTYNQVYIENEETKKLIRHEAEHDGLTDLLNRKSFDKMLEIYKNSDSVFALILVDVDVFKSVNDTYGHATGDLILKKVAKLLKQEFRTIDHICRIGGDEFAVIMVDMNETLKYTIEAKIFRMNQALQKAQDDLPKVSLSVGVAFSNQEGILFENADQALYKTKEKGKCGCSFYETL